MMSLQLKFLITYGILYISQVLILQAGVVAPQDRSQLVVLGVHPLAEAVTHFLQSPDATDINRTYLNTLINSEIERLALYLLLPRSAQKVVDEFEKIINTEGKSPNGYLRGTVTNIPFEQAVNPTGGQPLAAGGHRYPDQLLPVIQANVRTYLNTRVFNRPTVAGTFI